MCWSPDPGDSPVAHPVRPHRPARYDLSQCSPDFRAFPRTKWLEAMRKATETASFDQLGYPEEGGDAWLRAVLAEHLHRRRAAAVTPATLCIFSGATSSMSQLARALAADGHSRIGVEHPGSNGLWEAARSAGLELVPVPADADGLVVTELAAQAALRAVCVGPAHNVATGAVLAPHRRTALLEWARRAGGVIAEDDYDSEFGFGGPVPPVLQGSDPGRVALLGSMSRTMTPSVNIGWVVAPRRLVPSVRAAPPLTPGPPALTQLALAYYLESGGYDRHLRGCRQRLRRRRAALLAALARELPECPVSGAPIGLHLLIELPLGTDRAAVIAAAERRGVRLCNIDDTRFEPDPAERRLQIGYGNLADPLVTEAISVLADVIHSPTGRGN